MPLVRDKSRSKYRIFLKHFGDHRWWKPALRLLLRKLKSVCSNCSTSFHSQLCKRKENTWAPLQFIVPHSSMDLSEICDNATKGREFALLGNYDSSAVYYEGVLQQIHKHCHTLRDPAIKVKWQQVRPLKPSNQRIPRAVTPTSLCLNADTSNQNSVLKKLTHCVALRHGCF